MTMIEEFIEYIIMFTNKSVMIDFCRIFCYGIVDIVKSSIICMN